MNYTSIHPYPYLTHYRDPQGVCFTIIQGSTCAMVVDTGYGINNLRQFVESNVTTPYIVVNTHGHMDHTAGNFWFEQVYVPEKDIELCKLHNSKERRRKNIIDAINKKLIDDSFNQEAYINQGYGTIIPLKNGHIFDLGNLHIEVIPMEGHTKGSIGLLIKEDELLLTGDAAISMIWLFLGESTDKETYIKMLNRVKELPFKSFITGHLLEVFDKKFFDYYLEVAENANIHNSIPTIFPNFERPNTYQYCKKFGSYNIGICFQEPKED